MKMSLAVLTLVSVLFSGLTMAQPEALEIHKAEYKQKWQALVQGIENRSDLSFTQKLTVYEQEVAKLKKQYQEERVEEYNSNEVTITVDHQCKGRPAGSTRNCGVRCAERPDEDMFTKVEWVTFSGDYMDEVVNEEKACFKLEAKGNVKKEGSVSAVFKYRTNYVGYITADDADALFNSFLTE